MGPVHSQKYSNELMIKAVCKVPDQNKHLESTYLNRTACPTFGMWYQIIGVPAITVLDLTNSYQWTSHNLSYIYPLKNSLAVKKRCGPVQKWPV